jgi:hypothetical protein
MHEKAVANSRFVALPVTWVQFPACSIYAADHGLERSGGSLPAYCLSDTTTL